MMRIRLALGLLAVCWLPALVPAQEEAPEKPAHAEIRQLRDELLKDVEASDIDGMLAALHPDVIVTFMDGTQCDGPDAVKAYFNRMLKGEAGEAPVVKSFSTEVEVPELTTLYGDNFGVSYGTSKSNFVLTNGSTFTVDGVWTATLVKEDDAWKIASFQSSAGLFDNPLLTMAEGWIVKAAGIAGVAGLVIGALAIALLKRNKS